MKDFVLATPHPSPEVTTETSTSGEATTEPSSPPGEATTETLSSPSGEATSETSSPIGTSESPMKTSTSTTPAHPKPHRTDIDVIVYYTSRQHRTRGNTGTLNVFGMGLMLTMARFYLL